MVGATPRSRTVDEGTPRSSLPSGDILTVLCVPAEVCVDTTHIWAEGLRLLRHVSGVKDGLGPLTRTYM